MTATIADVAERAGVSTATVSRVLAGVGRARPETQARVLEAARDLGYRPSEVARSLKRRSTQTLGLIITDIENPYFPQLVRAVEDAARAAGYSVLLCNAADDPEREASYLDLLVDRRVDGLIVAASNLGARQSEWLTAPPIPVFMALIGMKAQAASEKQLAETGSMNAFLLDRLRGLATIRALGAVDATARRLRADAESLRERRVDRRVEVGLLEDLHPHVQGFARVRSAKVLEQERNPAERSGRDVAGCLLACGLGAIVDDRVDLRVDALGPLDRGLDELGRARLPRLDQRRLGGRVHPCKLVAQGRHPFGRGRKRS